MPPPLWDINYERSQAEEFCFRASILEQADAPDASLLRELVDLCLRKAEIMGILERDLQTFTASEWRQKTLSAGRTPWEDRKS
jgi:hypothetical protein